MIFDILRLLISAGGAGLLALLIIALGIWMYVGHRRRRRLMRVRRDFVDMLLAYRQQRLRFHIRREAKRVRAEFHARVQGYQAKLASCAPVLTLGANKMASTISASPAWHGLSPAGHPASKALLKGSQWHELLVAVTPYEDADVHFLQAFGGYLAGSGPDRVLAVLSADMDVAQARVRRAVAAGEAGAETGARAPSNAEEDLARVQRQTKHIADLIAADGVLTWCDPEALSVGVRAFLEDKLSERLSTLNIDGVARTVLGPVKTMELMNWLQRAAEPPLLLPASDPDLRKAHGLAVMELPSDAKFLEERAHATLARDVKLAPAMPDVIRMTTEVAGLSLRMVLEGEQSIKNAFAEVLAEVAAGRRESPYVSPQVEAAVAESNILTRLGIEVTSSSQPGTNGGRAIPPDAEPPAGGDPVQPAGGSPTGEPENGRDAGLPRESLAPETDVLEGGASNREAETPPAAVERWNRLLEDLPGFWIDEPEER